MVPRDGQDAPFTMHHNVSRMSARPNPGWEFFRLREFQSNRDGFVVSIAGATKWFEVRLAWRKYYGVRVVWGRCERSLWPPVVVSLTASTRSSDPIYWQGPPESDCGQTQAKSRIGFLLTGIV